MNKAAIFAAIFAAGVCLGAEAKADTTVTVDEGSTVSVNRQPVAGGTVVQTTAAPAVMAVESDRDVDVSGRIVAVDAPNSEITVRDERPRDRRIKGDPGIVSTLKVGDFVDVRMRHGSQTEAFRIIER